MKALVEKEIAKGVSRRVLASRVGVSLGTVQNLLLGDTELKNSTIEKFCRYFKVSFDPKDVLPAAGQMPPVQFSSSDSRIAFLESTIATQAEFIKHLSAENTKMGEDLARIGKKVDQIGEKFAACEEILRNVASEKAARTG